MTDNLTKVLAKFLEIINAFLYNNITGKINLKLCLIFTMTNEGIMIMNFVRRLSTDQLKSAFELNVWLADILIHKHS